jgi:hypothetical protein
VLGCLFSGGTALAQGETQLALWSLSALLTSLAALFLLHRRRSLYLRASVRNWLYAGVRLHRACAIVAMRRALSPSALAKSGSSSSGNGSSFFNSAAAAGGGRGGLGSLGAAAGDRVYFAKAVLVNSSILPILLQSLVLQLPLGMQAAVQVRRCL